MFQPDLDCETVVLCALESTHAALAIMSHHDMPKQLYREEVCSPLIFLTFVFSFGWTYTYLLLYSLVHMSVIYILIWKF